jgi:hypothetical protein
MVWWSGNNAYKFQHKIQILLLTEEFVGEVDFMYGSDVSQISHISARVLCLEMPRCY